MAINHRLRINLATHFLMGMGILAVNLVVVLLILENIYGRTELAEILPTRDNLKRVLADDDNVVAILHSEYTENVLADRNTWLSDNVNVWKRFVKAAGLRYEVIGDQDIETGWHNKYKLIILAGSKALSRNEIIQLKRYTENGGSIFASGGTASFDENGNWRGWEFLTEVFGLRFTKEISPDEGLKEHTLIGGLAMTAGIPTGYAFRIAAWDRPISCKVVELRSRQASFWQNLMNDSGSSQAELEESAGIVFGKYGKGRFIWMGFELSSVIGKQEDHIYLEKLFKNSIHWLTQVPTVVLKDWPGSYAAAAIVAPFLSGDFSNVANIFSAIELEKIPVTFFVDPAAAESNQELVKELPKYGAIGAIADLGLLASSETRKVDLYDFKTQLENLRRSKLKLESLAGAPVHGAFPMYGAYDENSVHALIEAGYDYIVTDSLLNRDVPQTLIKGKKLVVSFSRSSRDDYEVIERYGLKNTDFQVDTYVEDINKTLLQGGLYVLKIHPDYQCQPQFAPVFQRVVEYLRQRNVWLAPAVEIKNWWAAKNALEIQAEFRSNRRVVFVITNPGKTAIKDFVVQIHMNKAVRNIDISSGLIGTRIPKHVFDKNSQIVQVNFDYIQAGESLSYFVDFDNVN